MVMEKHVMRLMNVPWEQMHVPIIVQIQMVDTTVAVHPVMFLMLMDSLAMVSIKHTSVYLTSHLIIQSLPAASMQLILCRHQ